MINKTSELIAQVLVELAKTKEIEKIQVVDICLRAGCSKQTFYNHFRDKYDVVSWLFSKSAYRIDPSGECYYSVENLESALQAIWDHRDFFRVAFISEGQNSLYEYIVRRDMEFNGEIMLRAFHLEKLDEQMIFLLRYHIYGCLGYVTEWLKSDTPVTPKELAELEYRYMPEELKKAWAARQI